jgi:hypothetical protein
VTVPNWSLSCRAICTYHGCVWAVFQRRADTRVTATRLATLCKGFPASVSNSWNRSRFAATRFDAGDAEQEIGGSERRSTPLSTSRRFSVAKAKCGARNARSRGEALSKRARPLTRGLKGLAVMNGTAVMTG